MDDDRKIEDEDAVDPADDEVEVEGDEAEEEEEEGNTTVDESESDSADDGADNAHQIDESTDDTLDEVDEDTSLLSGDEPKVADLEEVEVANYRITGLVDYTDEQGNIVGQLPKDSIQELPVVIGDRAVEAGQAERV